MNGTTVSNNCRRRRPVTQNFSTNLSAAKTFVMAGQIVVTFQVEPEPTMNLSMA